MDENLSTGLNATESTKAVVVNKDSRHGHTVNISLCTDRTVGDVMLVPRGEKAVIFIIFAMT